MSAPKTPRMEVSPGADVAALPRNDKALHPDQALFAGERTLPAIAACDHYAGAEKLIRKALELQQSLGPVFDVTCDCEDGAAAGREGRHAEMIAGILASPANAHGRAGARIHDILHPHWKDDVEILVGGAGDRLAFLTLPKCDSAAHVAEMIAYIREVSRRRGLAREIPVHVLVETHGALHEAWEIAALPGVQALAFGLMDFVSGHHGAIHASRMRSPGQFEHPLIVRAKARIAAAALAHGVVPAHNVSLDLRNPESVFRDARRARDEFGYLRMWSIHPSQIRPIVDAMKPDLDEVADAAAILLAARRADWGPIRYKDELHDRATYRYYWQLLRKARVTGVGVPDEAAAAFFGQEA